MKAHLRGQPPPLSAPQLDLVLDVANAAGRELLGAERTAEAYWLAQYFAAAPPGEAWPGELVCWVRQETGVCSPCCEFPKPEASFSRGVSSCPSVNLLACAFHNCQTCRASSVWCKN